MAQTYKVIRDDKPFGGKEKVIATGLTYQETQKYAQDFRYKVVREDE